jgi:hypothetical protein
MNWLGRLIVDVKLFRTGWCLLGALVILAGVSRACANNAGAVVLVNSQSARYADFQHYIQPYLGNFGVPYTVLDIASNAVSQNLTNYALIIVGHAALDTNNVYLTGLAQSNIAFAVSNGTGLVSFDNVLSGASNAPLYQFEQVIFGFGYSNPVSGTSVVFPPTGPLSQMSYITLLHPTNQILLLSNAVSYTSMTVAGLQLPTNATAVATCGGAPFLVTVKYGQGRAVQWSSYDWMSSSIQGPVNGLDDLVWRGFVWSARKPFVMRGFPNLVTLRVDDVAGPFWWIHYATNAGFKPFLALFTDEITSGDSVWPADGRMADLRGLTASGSVTASMHSFSQDTNSFFYFNHATETPWPDSTMSSNYVRGTLWHQTNGIPISKVVVLHFAEIGTNAFNGLTNWGVQFVLINVVPGTVEYLAPYAAWLAGGPYRLYETPQTADTDMPNYYADFLTVPGHPELNGKFFNCYCEIRNAGLDNDWSPEDADVPGSVARGYNMVKRGFDSMTLATLFTHEWFITYENSSVITSNHWQAMLQGITNALAPYNPIYVTLDYGCQYARATRTSQLVSADFDPVAGRVSATLSGTTDLPLSVNVYTGADSSITNTPGTVPMFTGTTNVAVGYESVPARLIGATIQNNNGVFTLVGQCGHTYGIEVSADNHNWTQVQTVPLTNGPVVISQPLPATSQFFRAKFLQ